MHPLCWQFLKIVVNTKMLCKNEICFSYSWRLEDFGKQGKQFYVSVSIEQMSKGSRWQYTKVR